MSYSELARNRGPGCRIPGMTGTVAQQTSVRRVRGLVVGRGKFRAARRPPGTGRFLRAGVGCIRTRGTACVEWRYADFRPTRATVFSNQLQGEPPEKIRISSDKSASYRRFVDLPNFDAVSKRLSAR